MHRCIERETRFSSPFAHTTLCSLSVRSCFMSVLIRRELLFGITCRNKRGRIILLLQRTRGTNGWTSALPIDGAARLVFGEAIHLYAFCEIDKANLWSLRIENQAFPFLSTNPIFRPLNSKFTKQGAVRTSSLFSPQAIKTPSPI